MTIVDAAAIAISAAGLCAPAIAAAVGSYRAGIGMMLELWTAAGLLRLTDVPSWPTIIIAAVLVSLRKLLLLSLSR